MVLQAVVMVFLVGGVAFSLYAPMGAPDPKEWSQVRDPENRRFRALCVVGGSTVVLLQLVAWWGM